MMMPHLMKLAHASKNIFPEILGSAKRSFLLCSTPRKFRHEVQYLSKKATSSSSVSIGENSAFLKPQMMVSSAIGHFLISPDRKELQILPSLAGKTPVVANQSRFQATWLRYNCHCPACKQPYSGQKLIEPHQLLPSYQLHSIQLQDNELLLGFTEDSDHITIIPIDFLHDNSYSLLERVQDSALRDPQYSLDGIPTLNYSEFASSRQGRWRWLKLLSDYGICIVTGLPVQDGIVQKVAEMICPAQETIYGKVFDVTSTPKPINVAYSCSKLGFHMDLVYYESAPGLQLLNCLRFDDCVSGGESLFCDAFHVAEQLRTTFPDHFRTLTEVPATFQKIHLRRDRPVHMKYARPHIRTNRSGKITAVFWAPAFEGPLFVDQDDVGKYYEAYNVFAQMIETSITRTERRMSPGEMVVFNNRRILHGRNEFVLNGGERFLQGCYVNIDEFRNEVEVAALEFDAGRPCKRVGNQDHA